LLVIAWYLLFFYCWLLIDSYIFFTVCCCEGYGGIARAGNVWNHIGGCWLLVICCIALYWLLAICFIVVGWWMYTWSWNVRSHIVDSYFVLLVIVW